MSEPRLSPTNHPPPEPEDSARPDAARQNAARQDAALPDRILSTKLLPPRLPAALVARPALFARLDAGLSRRLILVTAPTGFGKTTLVSLWLVGRKIPFVWVTLDESDNDPVRFWSYVVTALRGLDSSLGKAALAELRTAQQPAVLPLLTRLINELAGLRGPCVLVLEDYHAITSPEINEALAFLLNHLPEPLHLVLITRAEPDLPLGILRARDELVEIEAASLRFSRAEITAFFQQAAPAVPSSAALEQLEERTEGWPAGLRLAALALQGRRTPQEIESFVSIFSGSHRYVLEYLVKEVFAGLPEQAQSFLLRTSPLDRFCAELCEEVVGDQPAADGQPLLDFLYHSNLFITRLETADSQPWYRYHPLFAEAIRYRARQELGEAGLQRIYERASRWHERRRMMDEAVEYALRARQFDRSAQLIERQVELRSMNGLLTLRRWAAQLPQETLRRFPQLSFAYAQAILYTADRFSPAILPLIEPLLRIAEDAWRASSDNLRLGELLAIRANLALWQGDYRQAFTCAAQSLELLPEDAIHSRAIGLLLTAVEQLEMGRLPAAYERALEARALFGAAQNPFGVNAAVQAMSEIYFLQGSLEPAAQLEQQILDEIAAAPEVPESMLDDQGMAWLGLGRVAYERNDLESAALYSRQALDASAARGDEHLLARAAVLQARIQAAQGHLQQALSGLQALAARVRHPSLLREVLADQAWLALAAPEPILQHAWRAAVALPDDAILPMQKEREALALARLRLVENKPAEALTMLHTWREDAAAQGRARSEVEILCLEALAHQSAGDLPRAAQSLTRALTIAQAKGLRRLLLDFGPALLQLLAQVTPGLSRRPLAVYAAALQQAALLDRPAPASKTLDSTRAASTIAPASPLTLIEPLSPQELRVLRLIAAGLSNPEIARELVVSVNTIKTQVQSIYRKLNVTSREEARQAASNLPKGR